MSLFIQFVEKSGINLQFSFYFTVLVCFLCNA